MKILALIDDLQFTIKLKTLIILIIGLVCFLVSLALFLLSWFRFRKQTVAEQDRANRARSAQTSAEDNSPGQSTRAAQGRSELQVSHEGDEPGPKTQGSKSEPLAYLESKMKEMSEQLSQTLAAVSDLSNRLDATKAAMSDALTQGLQQEEQRRMEDEKSRQLEEERQRVEELERSKAAVAANLQKRLEELENSDLLQIAILTKRLLAEVTGDSSDRIRLAENFPDYIQAATQAEDLRVKLGSFDSGSEPQPTYSQEEIAIEFDSFERTMEALQKDHRAVWFTDLLEEIGRHSSLRDKASDLKRLLKLEEVEIATGSVHRDLDEFEVVSAEGRGNRAIISEVLENGYRLTETGTVLKRPKVRVHFEV